MLPSIILSEIITGEKFEAKKRYISKVVELLTRKYGEGVITLTLKDQYYNMREMVEPHPEVIDKAFQAMKQAGVTPIVRRYAGGPMERVSRTWGYLVRICLPEV